MYNHDNIFFCMHGAFVNPLKSVVDWTNPLWGTYPPLTKGPRPEI